ncbi:serine carboxypeptidase-like 18 isoform X2 [Gastrolobium bilobum]|uniref:serine carboxypeptidase-like 18 isoform X2 n=1 Tax=Gastrolobium bilobum TaxID=150636 RepID=UPI002AB0E5F7|nr:serine carboxypeptidase-like 18 isoform X2 [Gastrolobium bilobum]
MEKATATVRVTATHSKCIKFLWGLILLLAQSNSVASNAIVKSLPGFPGELPFLLETGYIGVGELDEEVQLFYYFIESEGQPATDPLVLWLTGGPGCSALSGLMYEVGPLGFDYKRSCEIQTPVLVLNDYSWTKVANIIFLDASVGTGFSYAKTSGGYNTSDEKSTADTYMFLRKWLLVHPKFQKNPVYIAGDSYSGIAVPVIVKKISDGNKAGNLPQINLKGYVLGNPYTDNQYDLNARVNFAYRVGLLSDDLYEETKFDCHGEFAFPNKSDAGCIEHLEMVNQDYNYIFINIWANDKVVQEALHVRIGTIKEWDRCNRSLSYVEDIRSSLDYHRNLTSEDLRAIVYSGDHDMVIPYVGTEEWIRSLNLKVPSDGEWRPWFVDGQVAGYTEMYREKKYSLTFATVKGGGHTAPEYKPKECFDMISRWFAYYFL